MEGEGITLTADSVSYYLPSTKNKYGKRRKALLRGVSLTAKPGQLMYIMGPSGAGKSTLLDLLAGRLTTGWLGGEMYFNHMPSKEAWRRLSQHIVYIRQADVHQPSLTVRETLDYAARFHLAGDAATRTARVDEVARLLGLQEILDNRVGGQFQRGISGGQLKRLSIGVEIMQTPALLLLDEPTSGLDSVMAREVMLFVSDICKRSAATVICTIHQPSEEVLSLSQSLVVLARGYVCFRGSPSQARHHFLQYCRDDVAVGSAETISNPAEFLLEVVSGPSTRAARLHNLFLSSPSNQQEPLPPSPASPSSTALSRSTYRRSLLTQVCILVHRAWKVLLRRPTFLRTIMVRDVFAGILYGAVLYQQGSRHKASDSLSQATLNLSSLLYFVSYSLLWQNMEALGQYFSWRALCEKERSGHAYSTLALTLATPLFVLPYTLLGYFIFLALVCLLADTWALFTGLHGIGLLSYAITMLNAYLFASSLAAWTRSPEMAYVATPIAFVFMGTLTGFVVTWDNMPLVWQKLSYAVYTRYHYRATVEIMFRGRPDYEAVMRYLSLDRVLPLGLAQCIGVLLGFTVFFATVLHWALLPPRVRLKRAGGPKWDEGRASSNPNSRPVSRAQGLCVIKGKEAEDEESLRVRLLAAEEEQVILEEDQDRDDEEDKDDREASYAAPCADLSRRPTLTLADFCARSASLPPANGGVLYFRDVRYSVDVGRAGRRRTLEVLKGNISGMVSAGEMMALMGPSGAGKTTLLDVLASYKTVGRVQGRIVTSKEVKRWCYVTQDDVHLATLTVRETLQFAALLRIEEGVSLAERWQRVEDVERMLGLEDVREVLVGDNFHKGISGGQMRRLTIGVEIMNLPELIFLDEPTTGLDSATALEVMSAVRSLSLRGRLVVCTLHQPSPDIFALFDRLTALANGQLLYHGKTQDFPAYLTSPAVCIDPSSEPSLPDLVIKVASGVLLPSGVREFGAEDLANRFTTSVLGRALAADIGALEIRHRGQTGTLKKRQPRNWIAQVRILNYRQFKTIGKDFRSLVINNLNYVCLGLFWGTLFSGLHDAQTTLGLLFSGLMVVTFSNQLIIPVIYAQRPLLYRERAAGVYGTAAYCLSCDTPYLVMVAVTSLFFAALVYYWGGLRPGIDHWAFYYLCLALTSITSLTLIECLSALLPTEQELTAIWSLTGYVLSILSGYMSRLPSFPNWVQQCTKVSFTRWSFEGLSVNQFGDGEDEAFLAELGFANSSRWTPIIVISAMIVCFKLAQVTAVKYLTFERR